MNVLAGLEQALYVLSSVLFYPVVAGLLVLTLWVVVYAGAVVREGFDRLRGRFASRDALLDDLAGVASEQVGSPDLDLALEQRLLDVETRLAESVGRIRFVIRVGPSLGLMGTLIPMAIALVALSEGDVTSMAGRMVTAFSTTVIGLGCGVAAYGLTLAKEKWTRADVRALEFHAERLLRRYGTATEGARSAGLHHTAPVLSHTAAEETHALRKETTR